MEIKLKESERKRIEAEQLKIKAEQERFTAEKDKKEANGRTFIALQVQIDEEKRRILAEERIRTAEQKIRDIEQKMRIMEDKKNIDGQEMEDLLRYINSSQETTEMKISDWIEMKNDLEQEEVGTDDQKELIKQKKTKTCQKILATLIGKKNDSNKKLAIEAGIIEALLKFFTTHTLDQITISHIWSFYIFTYSSDEIKLLVSNKRPYPILFRLFDHSDIYVINRAIIAMYNTLLSGLPSIADNTKQHSHFSEIESCNGIQKYFALFLRNMSKSTKDFAALSIAQVFHAKELPAGQIRHEIIAYIKSLLNDEDAWTKQASQMNLKGLVLNSVNLAEIIKDSDLMNIANNLRRTIEGNEEEEKKVIIKQQESDCILLEAVLEKRKDEVLQRQIISYGIVDSLIDILLNYDIRLISSPFIDAFFQMTITSNDIKLLIYAKHPYPAMIRLLDLVDVCQVDSTIASIFNMLLIGPSSTEQTAYHPHLPEVEACNGVQKLFDAFSRPDMEKVTKSTAAFCIGHLLQSREITNQEMKKSIIAYLKSLVSDGDDWAKNAAKWRLKGLARNTVNRSEIETNGFAIPV
ncbi:MAG: hypothetical protein EZS28_011757 [Streblomastix strix]|uniref:Uncharacterized protein n=1 Tax=Streblomastix strix TaxID=222440 RepID=A0A5J4WCN4_9EUKA|nr:MAG: hypothetical protein EZS28_011757 [Streblomastix strix]